VKLEKEIIPVHTDSIIALKLLQNKKKPTKLIDEIRTKFQEMEQHELRLQFRWINAHAGHRGNEMADQKAKEVPRSNTIEVFSKRTQNCVAMNEQNYKDLSGGNENGRKKQNGQ